MRRVTANLILGVLVFSCRHSLAAFEEELDFVSHQGAPLEGGVFEGQRLSFDYSSARGGPVPFVRVQLEGAEFVGFDAAGNRYTGAAFQGVTFSSSAHPHQIRVSVYLPGRGYVVHYDGTGNKLCPYTTEHPEGAGMPIAGTWTRFGGHSLNDRSFTFACFDGVIAKCIEWGIVPWRDVSGVTIAGIGGTVPGVSLHQACTRMARADYCGDGISRTMNGTAVHYYSVFNTSLGLVGWQPPPGTWYDPDHEADPRYRMFFEAAWRPATQPGQPGAICLSKKRWSTIPLDGYCPDQLPDPRKDLTASFCEDYTEGQMEGAGALLFNDSAFIDLGLYAWSSTRDCRTDPACHWWTSSSFEESGVRGSFPPDGYSSPGNFVGAAFNPETAYVPSGLRELWAGISSDGLVATSTLPLPAGYLPLFKEGLIYTAEAHPPTAVKLYLWHLTGPTRYLTTTGLLGPPFIYDGVIGYLPR